MFTFFAILVITINIYLGLCGAEIIREIIFTIREQFQKDKNFK